MLRSIPMIIGAGLLLAAGCGPAGQSGVATREITVYSGRSEDLIQPLLVQFTEQTGIRVRVRYGQSSEMAATILEEGRNSPADLFFSQDAGALGALYHADRLATLPADLLEQVEPPFRSPKGAWVGVSGRARVVVYNSDHISPEELPDDLNGFCAPNWRGRVGWAPVNASFQSFVTAMRLTGGEEATRDWLRCMHANGARAFAQNTPILAAVASGEIDAGLTNHYYLHTLEREQGRPINVRNHHPRGGTLINVAGVGILRTAANESLAIEFVRFLLSESAQHYFTHSTFEYPLVRGATPNEALPPLQTLHKDGLDLSRLDDLGGTLKLLRDAGVL